MFLKTIGQKLDENQENVPSFGRIKLKEDEPAEIKLAVQKPSKKRGLGYLILVIFIISLAFLIWQGILFFNVYNSFLAISSDCGQVKEQFLAKNFSEVDQSLANCQTDIFQARNKLADKRILPVFGLQKNLEPVINFLDSLYDLTTDFKTLNNYAQNYYQSINPAEKNNLNSGDILTFINEDFEQIFVLSLSINKHKNELKQALEADNLFMRLMKKRLADKIAQLDFLDQTIIQSSAYLDILPELLGYNQEKTYLLLFQNNSELRPTGGFWGGYGILKVKDGQILKFDTDDIYHLDVNLIGTDKIPVPPEPIYKYLNKEWFFRDANWSPDFPSAAQTAIYFYNLEGGQEPQIDGVIALTPALLEDFLLYLGPIELDGLTFTRENFLAELEYEVEMGFVGKNISSWNRKDIIEPLAEKLIAKLKNSLTLSTINEVSNIFANNLSRKDLLIYFNNPKLQQEVLGHNWAGAIIGTKNDYLNIIDANLASFKTDIYIERQVTYQLKQVPKENNDYDLVANLKIEYQHLGNFDWKTTRYRTYTRVYLPVGTRLNSWQGVMADDRSSIIGGLDVFNELNKTVLGGFIAIEPQRGGVLEFNYTLPENIKKQFAEGKYQLIFQKQPGVIDKQINLDFDFAKPIKRVVHNQGSFSVFGNQLVFNSFNLAKDLEINIEF